MNKECDIQLGKDLPSRKQLSMEGMCSGERMRIVNAAVRNRMTHSHTHTAGALGASGGRRKFIFTHLFKQDEQSFRC